MLRLMDTPDQGSSENVSTNSSSGSRNLAELGWHETTDLRSTRIFANMILSNNYALMAFALGAGIRAIPVVLAWPYSVGFDTTALYIPLMLKGPPSLDAILTYPGLNSLLVWSGYQLFRQPFFVLDFFGAILQGALAWSSYVYGRSVVILEKKFAFLTSILFTLSPITLWLTWDQYRISESLVATMIALVAIRSQSRRIKLMTVPLTLVVVATNPLPSVFLLLTLMAQTLFDYRRSRPFVIGLLASTIGGVCFAVQLWVLATSGLLSSNVQVSVLGPLGGANMALFGVAFLIFTSWPLLSFLPWTIKLREFSPHMFWLLMVVFFAVVLLTAGIYIIPPAFVYLMSSFPLAMFSGVAIKRFSTKRVFRVFLVVVLAFLTINAASYLISSPLSPTGYMALDQPFRYYLPTGYLQSTVPISYQKDLMQLLAISMSSLPPDAILYLPRQFYGLGLMVQNPRHLTLVDIGEANPWNPSPFESVVSDGGSFTIWFIRGSSWYGISTLPTNFETIQTQGQFALYQIVS